MGDWYWISGGVPRTATSGLYWWLPVSTPIIGTGIELHNSYLCLHVVYMAAHQFSSVIWSRTSSHQWRKCQAHPYKPLEVWSAIHLMACIMIPLEELAQRHRDSVFTAFHCFRVEFVSMAICDIWYAHNRLHLSIICHFSPYHPWWRTPYVIILIHLS